MKHIVALLAGLAIALGIGLAAIPAQADLTARALAPAASFEPVAMTSPEPSPYGEPKDTIYIPAGWVSDAMFDALLEIGYEGDPSDGVEALYPSRTDALSNCYTDRDCWIADWSVSVPR